MKRLSSQHFHRSVRWTVVAAWAVALMWAFTLPAQTAHARTIRTPWQNLTLAQLTAVWWQWVLSIPVPTSPLFDETGANAYSGQPYSDLLFLCGTFTLTPVNGILIGEATRSISVKRGTAFFFPLLNGEADNVCGTPHLGGACPFVACPGAGFLSVLGVPELQACAALFQDGATALHTTLTQTTADFEEAIGLTKDLDYQQFQSPPFSFTLPATDNLYQYFEVDVSGTVAPAAANGYYSFIPGTLDVGYYLLQFGGTSPDGSFIQKITYNITVTP